MSAVLAVDDVEVSFGGFRALGGVSLEMEKGSCVAIVGPNGAGKSTLFAVIGGQTAPTAGRVRYRGDDISKLSPERRARRGLARTFQVARLHSSMTVEQSVVLADTLRARTAMSLRNPMRQRAYRDRALEVMRNVRLDSIASKKVSELSQGERKRLEFGLALVQRAELMVLDEPTAGMGADEVEIAVGVLHDIRRADPELSVLFSSHDMAVVFGLAERVVVMNQGAVIADDIPSRVATDEQVISIYLGVR